MAWQHDTLMNPPIEELLERAGSKFRLVTFGSMRGRQINSYFGDLGSAEKGLVPPQVTTQARKPLSVAFEEIALDKIEWMSADELAAEAQAEADAAAAAAADMAEPDGDDTPSE